MTAWKLAGFFGLALLVALYVLHLKGEIRHSEKEATRYVELFHAEQSAHRMTAANFQKATATAQAADAAHVVQIEREQAKVSQEVSNDYQIRLAALRARYDALRVREPGSAATADTSGRIGARVPQAGDPASGPDDGSPVDPFACEANTLQLGSLIDWVRQQTAIDSP
jgi:ribosomal 50S subunit-recycling heat shock protein